MNPYVNKVGIGNRTLIDLSGDSVDAAHLLTGYTAHDKSGAPISGAFDLSVVTAQAEDVKEGKVFISSTGTITIGTAEEGMTILAYGKSTWQEVIDAYKAQNVVYCRASSGSNPASGSQTRMAFMAYVNDETDPTEIEFQYYRSVSSHSDSQQGDQVYVYKMNKTNGWSVTTRNAFSKIVAGNGLTSSYANGVLTISLA